MIKHVLLTLLLIASSPIIAEIGHAQQCRDIPAGVPQKSWFTFLAEDVVVDQHNHLAWMRCSIGQHWDKEKDTCSGEPQTMTWFEAQQLANQPALNDQGWRLPSIHELSSITELRCYNPAIDLTVFPNAAASHYWTATAFTHKPGYFWLVQFLSGENHTDSGKRLAYVRLVKTVAREDLGKQGVTDYSTDR